TWRPMRRCRARYTFPIDPLPRSLSISYSPYEVGSSRCAMHTGYPERLMSDGKRTVLIVDDNHMMRKLLAAELGRDVRFEVVVAATGAEGLEKAVSANPAVIVLDMILPDLSGVQFL